MDVGPPAGRKLPKGKNIDILCTCAPVFQPKTANCSSYDASSYGLDGVLLQYHRDTLKLVAYWFHTLKDQPRSKE